jgi:uncharacterized protein YdhG (YjbR/CyaY superfamily)
MATARKTSTRKSTAAKATAAKTAPAFTEEERSAMKERAKEVKAAKSGKVDDATAVLDKIAEMEDSDRALAEKVHQVITDAAPGLAPRLWYGMPAYAKDGKVICFFKPKSKFKVRYASFEFQPDAALDDGDMWPVSFAVTKLTPAVEKQIAELVKKAGG